MNVLKVFDNQHQLKQAMYKFRDDNFQMIVSCNDIHGRMSLANGDKVWFMVITNLDQAMMQTCGGKYSWVEFIGFIEQDAKEFIWTRMRECHS
jgi:hypothetical protein